MYYVRVEAEFAAAHRIVHYHGKCERFHGHNYKVRVWFRQGTWRRRMLVDFSIVKAARKKLIDELSIIGPQWTAEFEDDPSAERIAKFIYDRLRGVLPKCLYRPSMSSRQIHRWPGMYPIPWNGFKPNLRFERVSPHSGILYARDPRKSAYSPFAHANTKLNVTRLCMILHKKNGLLDDELLDIWNSWHFQYVQCEVKVWVSSQDRRMEARRPPLIPLIVHNSIQVSVIGGIFACSMLSRSAGEPDTECFEACATIFSKIATSGPYSAKNFSPESPK